MKIKSRKIFAILAITMMLLTLLPATALAATTAAGGGATFPATTTATAATLNVGAGNAGITYTAVQRGTGGNAITVAYVVAGNNTPLTVAVVGTAITVNVATDAGGAATSTANAVEAAVDLSLIHI